MPASIHLTLEPCGPLDAVESVEWQSEQVITSPGFQPPASLAAVSWLAAASAVPTGWREALFGLNSMPRSVMAAAPVPPAAKPVPAWHLKQTWYSTVATGSGVVPDWP